MRLNCTFRSPQCQIRAFLGRSFGKNQPKQNQEQKSSIIPIKVFLFSERTGLTRTRTNTNPNDTEANAVLEPTALRLYTATKDGSHTNEVFVPLTSVAKRLRRLLLSPLSTTLVVMSYSSSRLRYIQ